MPISFASNRGPGEDRVDDGEDCAGGNWNINEDSSDAMRTLRLYRSLHVLRYLRAPNLLADTLLTSEIFLCAPLFSSKDFVSREIEYMIECRLEIVSDRARK